MRAGLLSPINGTKVELEEEPCFTVIAFWLHNNTATARKANRGPFCYGTANMICDITQKLMKKKSLN